MARFRWSLARIVAILIAAAVLFAAAYPLWLPALGRMLVRDDGPAKADIVVVLGGDATGGRILKGAELVSRGYAPVALVSGKDGFFGVHECDLAIPFAVRHGYPENWFIAFRHQATSTQEEAALVLAELRRRGLRSFLLVTSDFHTARAGRTFASAIRATGGGLTMRVVAAPDEYFHADTWWRIREGRKIFLSEWLKTFAFAFGI